jgi:molybdopterin-guanine dinucleotide biosynthesis protein A
MTESINTVGVLLAGGRARRMGGGDKCLLPLGVQTLLQRSMERAQPQVGTLLLSANGNALRFARTRLKVLADQFPDNPGPLAGIHAALMWMKEHQPDEEWLVSFACDTPFFPRDLVRRLQTAASTADTRLAVACSAGRVHPVFALWHASLLNPIEDQLQSGESPRMQEWVSAQSPIEVDFPFEDLDPFFNINAPQDLYAAEAQLSKLKD